MKGFLMKKGTPVLAAKRVGNEIEVEPKILKKDTMYFLEDLVLDPLNPTGNEDEKHYTDRGFYGFRLPNNPQGYTVLICHNKYIQI